MSTFWSAYIFVLTGTCILGIVALIHFTRKMPGASKPEETTGHVFDGIEEYNNPMPSWWLNMFWVSIAFALFYLAAYGLGNYTGFWGSTAESRLLTETTAHEAAYGEVYERFAGVPVEELANNPQSARMGQQLFLNNCAICHGQNAQGYYGFPNLTDDDWLYGGTGDAITTTLMNGRNGQMPAWRDTLGTNGVSAVAEYVLQISSNDYDPVQAARGEVVFNQMCVACHAADGTGNQAIGAPNLTDNIWLYDVPNQDLRRDIITSLNNGRAGNMPAWKDILGEEKIHLIAGYVHSLSN